MKTKYFLFGLMLTHILLFSTITQVQADTSYSLGMKKDTEIILEVKIVDESFLKHVFGDHWEDTIPEGADTVGMKQKIKVTDIMESAYPSPETEMRMVGDDKVPYDVLSPEQLMKKAAKLEKQMLKAARDLEFEEAARLRDEVHRMRDFSLGVTDKKAG